MAEAAAAPAEPFVVREWGKAGSTLFAARDVVAGEQVGVYGGSEATILPEPNVHSVQLSSGRHALATLGGMQYVAHMCYESANCCLTPVWASEEAKAAGSAAGVVGLALVAKRTIAANEPISFDYCTSEWDMDAPFECRCGDKECRGSIRGYKWLDAEQRTSLDSPATPAVLELAAMPADENDQATDVAAALS